MILLVTPNLRAEDLGAALNEATGEEVVVAESLRRAATLLRTESYTAVVVDQYVLETEPDEIGTTMQHLGTAIPVQVNLAISGKQRLAREIRAAVHRRKREEAAARQAAISMLHSELNGTVTALLLSCELALETPGLPRAAVEKLHSAHGLVKKLRAQLEPAEIGKN
jgi:hypothetical protein